MSYDVVGVLGRGGSAVVELALDSTGRQVATKRVALSGSAAQMRVARQRLRREAEILGSLAHPGIVPILDVIDDGSEVILVFPALAENLEDRVRRLGPLPPSEVARIGQILLEALAAAHRLGIVHRDIKPANVLFDHAGAPALADFGAAVTRRVTAGLTEAGTVVGTPMWMAPEQASGLPTGPASDVFSLAATLAFAATGQGPYVPGRAAAMLGGRARHEIRPLPAAVPGALRAVLTCMLDPRPGRRPSAAAVLGGLDGTRVAPVLRARRASVTALAGRVLGSSPALLFGAPSDRQVRSGRRRWPVVVAVLVVGVAAAGLGLRLVTLGTGTNRTPPPPHTNGKACDPGWYNLDGIAADGCEAHSDYVAGTALTPGAPVHANLVPLTASDSFATHVSGDLLNLCWGSLNVTLTAPAHTAEQLTVWKGASKVASGLSADGVPATATVHKPSCFSSDSEDLRVVVTAVAATGGASANDFRLTRDGGW